MDTIFMNSENSKTSKPHILILKLTDKLDKKSWKSIALSNLSYNSNKFKVSTPTWNDEFEWTDGSNSISYIQDYFEYIFKKHNESIDNPPIRIYVNRIKNKITFKIKIGYYLELLTPETIKLLASFKNKIKIMKMYHILKL